MMTLQEENPNFYILLNSSLDHYIFKHNNTRVMLLQILGFLKVCLNLALFYNFNVSIAGGDGYM